MSRPSTRGRAPTVLDSCHYRRTRFNRMKLHLDSATGVNVVRSYDASGITVNETRYTTSIILSADRVTVDWSVTRVSDFDESSCQPILEHDADIVLLGTGSELRWVEPRLIAWFASRGMGLEVMDTMAACRTFNILAAEQRRVCAALMLPG